MRRGLQFAGGGTSLDEIVTLSREAEAAGFDSLYLTEAWRSCFVGLAAMAAATERVRLGPCVLNAYARSPWITGMGAIDLDELSGGRLVLGVGTGNKHINEVWQGIPQERPLKKMEETITLLQRISRASIGDTVKFDGEVHHMDWPPAVQPVRDSIPVYLGAFFPKMLSVAGRVADGLILGSLMTPDYIKEVIRPHVEKSIVEAGRDPAKFEYLALSFVSVGEDGESARRAAREAICRLYGPMPSPYLDYALRENGFGKAADAAAKYMPEGDMDRAMEAMTDELIDSVTIAGTPDHCRARMATFEGAVDELIFVNVNYSSDETVGVVPLFRDLIALGAPSAKAGRAGH